MSRAWLAVVLLVAAGLAGCISDGDGQEDLERQNRAEVTEGTGGIEGVVTNAAVEPVPGANVTLVGLDRTVETAEDGSYAFSELPPDAYTVRVEADGFLSTEREVQAAAGAVQTVDVALTAAPDTLPYRQQFEFTGYMECSWGAAGGAFIASHNTCGEAGNTTNTKTTFTHEIEPDPWQVVTEVDWDPNSPASDRFWLAEEPLGFQNAWKVAYASEQETAPIVASIDRQHLTNMVQNFTKICEGEMDPSTTSNNVNNPDAYCNHNPIEKGGEVDITVNVQTASQATVGTPDTPVTGFPVGAGAGVQQEFTVYQTVFYHAPACEDFSVAGETLCEQRDQPPDEDPYDAISGGGSDG